MPNKNHLLHKHLSKKKEITFLDRLAMAASFISPATGVPQAIDVYHGRVQGVSLPSWIGFMIFSVLFTLYGLIHKVKPMVIANLLWLLVEGTVVAGIIIHR